MSGVRGPTSALTEFLREKNIHVPNANRFRRRDEPPADGSAQAGPSNAPGTATATATASSSTTETEENTSMGKRKATSAAAQSKAQAKKPRKSKAGASMNFDEEDDDDTLTEDEEENGADANQSNIADGGDGNDKWEQISSGQLADVSAKNNTSGSLDHCPGCNKRFCITSYTCHTPSGGLCHKCGPQYLAAMAQGKGTARSAGMYGKAAASSSTSAPAAATKGRRPVQRKKKTMQKPQDKKVLPSLQSMAIDIISQYIEDVEALGGIGEQSLDTLSKSICKSRRLNSQTVQLFLETHTTNLNLYDCSKLDTHALQSIATFSPRLTRLNLQLCGQLNNEAVDAWSEKLNHLKSIELYGPYLVRTEAWHRFFERVGHRLESFKVRESARFDLGCVEKMVNHCPNLQEVGLAQIGPLDGPCLKVLSGLKNLRYLDISDPGVSAPGVPPKSLEDDEVIDILSHVGENLEHLHIGGNADLTDRVVLEGILPYCSNLQELNLAHCDKIQGDALAILFDSFNARDYPGVQTLCLERCRGITNESLRAIVQHSGPKLVSLNLNSCTQLTKGSLKILAGDWADWQTEQQTIHEETRNSDPPSGRQLVLGDFVPEEETDGCLVLAHLDIGFVRSTDDDVLVTLMDGCKTLKEVRVFGCQRISDTIASNATCKIIGLERVPLIAKNVVE
ncbi:unnamed protein product [Sympodiomycopsis kandeliae]